LRIGVDARELQGKPTGTGRYLRNLLRHLSSGPETIVAYFNGRAPQDERLRKPAIEIRELGGGGESGLWWQQTTLPAAARDDRLSVFFSPAYTCPLRLRVPRVTAIHDLSFFALPEEFPLLDGIKRRWLVRASARASSAILACSEFTRREIASRLFEVRDRVRHIPLGADDDLLPPPNRDEARRALGVEGPLVLSVGSLFNRRCVRELLQATALLTSRFPSLRLEIVGENRSHPFQDFQSIAAEMGLRAQVRFTGFVDEASLALRYAAADVAVALSTYEGFGLPALEAAARGVPLVASDRPALAEICARAALLVDPTAPEAIAAALGRCLEQTGLRADLRERGLRLARELSWKATAERTLAVIAEAARA